MAYSIGTNDNDSLQGTRDGDIVFALGGDDVISTYARQGNSAEADRRGRAADKADLVFAADGDDLISAGAGADTISAGAGDDRVAAGAGADAIFGGAGDDVFVFERLGSGRSLEADTGVGRGARDTIADFQPGEDLIDLSGYAEALGADVVWIGTNAPTNVDGLQVGYRVEGASTVVRFYAEDSSGGRGRAPRPTGEIELVGPFKLTESDFIF